MTATSQAPLQARFSTGLVLPPGAFRLVLAAAVVVSHLTRADIGRLAVLLFFYLSGYWTARIWQEKFGATALWRYYAARYLRIAPLYLLAVLGAAALRQYPLGPVNFTLLGVASNHRDPTGVSWSLDVELQFYLLLPLVALVIAKAPRWLVIVASLAISAVGVWLGQSFGVVTVAKYLPAFVLGSMTYATAWKPSARAANISLAAFVAMTGITAFTPFLDKNNPRPFDQDIWGFIWMAPLLPYVARSLTIRSTKLDRHLGNLSYPLYLAHLAIITYAYAHFGDGTLVKLGAAVTACVVALAAYVLFDRPVDAWRVRLTEADIAPGAGSRQVKP